MKPALTSLICVLFLGSSVFAQGFGTIRGLITDENENILAGASIIDLTSSKGIVADAYGIFQMSVIAGKTVSLEVSYVGYLKDTVFVIAIAGETTNIKILLKSSPKNVGVVVVESIYDKAEALQHLDIRSLSHIPLPSGNVESLLTTMGASIRNEMSSQYSVRGGNFDENLIYVNGIEIYRPMLVKEGQQEGLSFINPDMVSSVQFAAGGFDARYGDKMSSVLDIVYKRPAAFAGGFTGSLLGATAHAEGTAFNKKFTHITGIRYKSNQYLLKSMQTKGDFRPRFFDLQTFLTYIPVRDLEISFLGNVAVNTYLVVPQSRETSFGTYQQPLNFTVYYEGQEKDRFTTLLGALTLNYHLTDVTSMKLTFSGFNTSEGVTYDILGQYRIDLLDNTPGSKTSGDSILNLGYGGNLKHARNYLNADIFNISYAGKSYWKGNNLNWGINAQTETFSDKMREWEMIDSAGFSMPYSDQELKMQHVVIAHNKITSYRISGYFQSITSFEAGSSQILLNSGFRLNYLNTSGQLVFSPRMSVYLIPAWENNITFHASAGWYHQPAFFKEMIDPEGKLHRNIKAQRAIHFLAGTTWEFTMWERPFKFSAEGYYKKLDHLVPYIIDDVDIQYIPQYTAKGYATGIEFKINGEFVKDAESWASLSFLSTREDRLHDAYGSYPRPTDQLVNFGLYFQDYFPYNPSFRVHLNMFYGSKLPYNTTDYNNPRRYFHLQSYRRIDVGLSKSLLTDRNGNRRTNFSVIKDLWFSAEVFNLFGFKNQASYQWVRTVSNQEGIPNIFAVPNYLTGRILNFKFNINF